MTTDSGWLQRKTTPLRVTRDQQPINDRPTDEAAPTPPTPNDEGRRDEDGEDENGDDVVLRGLRRRRNRVSEAPSEDEPSSSESSDHEMNATDQLLFRDDSDDDEEEELTIRQELGLEDEGQWNILRQENPRLFLFQQHRPPLRVRRDEIALHLADNGGPNDVVDIENTQENEAQEIDLTTLSSDSEAENGDDNDDEVEIVGSTASVVPIHDVRLVPGRNRKRRRTNDTPAAATPFDTQRVESTNISLENNETIERFKAALKCSVCLEVIEDMTSTICGHVYCAKCIRLAIRVTQKCPLCQRQLRPTDIHGLYF